MLFLLLSFWVLPPEEGLCTMPFLFQRFLVTSGHIYFVHYCHTFIIWIYAKWNCTTWVLFHPLDPCYQVVWFWLHEYTWICLSLALFRLLFYLVTSKPTPTPKKKVSSTLFQSVNSANQSTPPHRLEPLQALNREINLAWKVFESVCLCFFAFAI